MEKANGMDGRAQFAAMVMPLLAEAVEQASGARLHWEDSAAPAAPDEAEPVALALRCEGALAGHCLLVGSREHVTRLAGDRTATPEALLDRVLELVSEPLAAALSAHYGVVRVHRHEAAGIAADGELLGRLRGAEGEALSLLADGELMRGLGRLARVAAAAEASGFVHGNLGLVMDVELDVTLRFGQRQLSLREVMELTSGSVVELDREVDEPVELLLEDRVIARGEAVIVDGNYGVRITEVLQPVVL